MTRHARHRAPEPSWGLPEWAVLTVILMFVLVLACAPRARWTDSTPADCLTDADCAAWEVRHNVPEAL